MKFEKEKVSALTGQTEVRFKVNDFIVVAHQGGVEFRGQSPTFESLDDLNNFAHVVDQAWREHLRLKPKIEVADSRQLDMFN